MCFCVFCLIRILDDVTTDEKDGDADEEPTEADRAFIAEEDDQVW